MMSGLVWDQSTISGLDPHGGTPAAVPDRPVFVPYPRRHHHAGDHPPDRSHDEPRGGCPVQRGAGPGCTASYAGRRCQGPYPPQAPRRRTPPGRLTCPIPTTCPGARLAPGHVRILAPPTAVIQAGPTPSPLVPAPFHGRRRRSRSAAFVFRAESRAGISRRTGTPGPAADNCAAAGGIYTLMRAVPAGEFGAYSIDLQRDEFQSRRSTP